MRNENAGRRARVFVCRRAVGAKNIHQLHPHRRRAASQVQAVETPLREITMSKLITCTAAFALFAPIATAILLQAAQIVA
jgi:hypothetical protein